MSEQSEQELLEKIFDDTGRLWKGKYKVQWCDLCETAIIVCPEKECTATSCNSESCEKCHDDLTEFNKTVKTCVEDYMSDREIRAYYKAKRLKHFIMESAKDGDFEINWMKLKEEGRWCQNDSLVFHKELEAQKYAPCKECGGKPCICCYEEGMWAAHCMDCDNTIGERGFYDPCAISEEEAEIRWNKMNTKE